MEALRNGIRGIAEKCRWPNDAQAAAVLMIDDLSYGYLNHHGSACDARSDWGYGCRRKDSIFEYFERNILERFPEARYTVFLPFGRHSIGQVPTGYHVKSGDIFESREFGDLLGHIVGSGNEIAYHGHNHGMANPTLDPLTWSGEFVQYRNGGYAEAIRKDIERIRSEIGIRVSGGKFPGYRYHKSLEKDLAGVGLDWWVFDFDPAKTSLGFREGLVDIPANLSGKQFNRSSRPLLDWARDLKRRKRLIGIIESGGLVSIQEHFMSTRPDGKRQTPNLFDDVLSLEIFFGTLRGFDIWHATCSQIAAHARDCEDTVLEAVTDRGFAVRRRTGEGGATVTLRSGKPRMRREGSADWIEGAYKRGHWIYNSILPGQYEFG